jgi:hypothetical protein
MITMRLCERMLKAQIVQEFSGLAIGMSVSIFLQGGQGFPILKNGTTSSQ